MSFVVQSIRRITECFVSVQVAVAEKSYNLGSDLRSLAEQGSSLRSYSLALVQCAKSESLSLRGGIVNFWHHVRIRH